MVTVDYMKPSETARYPSSYLTVKDLKPSYILTVVSAYYFKSSVSRIHSVIKVLFGLCKAGPTLPKGPSWTDIVRAHSPKSLLPGKALRSNKGNGIRVPHWKDLEVKKKSHLSTAIKGVTFTQIECDSLVTIFNVISFDFLSFNLEYVTWPVNNTSQTQFSRIVLDEYGKLKLQSWSEDEQEWNSSLQSSGCGDYFACGTFSICNETAQDPCGCLPGFKPVSADVWSKGKVSRDCVRKTALHCSNNSDVQNDGFLPMSRIDWPDSPLSFDIGSGKECESACLNTCSCIAYAYEDNYRSHKNKSKCLEWTGSLSYLKQLPDDDGHDFYLKLSPLDLLTNVPISRNESSPAVTPGATEGVMLVRAKQLVTILAISLPLATLMLGLFVYCVWRKLRMTSKGEDLVQLDLGMTIKSENSEQMEENKRGDIRKKEVKMPLFSFASVSAATDNFSDANKLGEGGFGPVYKGILLKGDLVAVKRLSRRSGQGWEELKNEAMLIAKLQHNNLVRLLGCCIEQDEKILIYEHMPNKSLDFFIFDPEKRKILDWQTRIRVVEGVAQGLLYLHQYSRLRIIHRDLKASNILLDSEMNPKISDFGMARIFGGNESQANTNRIVGT
uniref:Uncharacterized protein n=1 Tax=Quercus lobata TaxID=97700 RepID=A0A7N2MA95_QUELO